MTHSWGTVTCSESDQDVGWPFSRFFRFCSKIMLSCPVLPPCAPSLLSVPLTLNTEMNSYWTLNKQFSYFGNWEMTSLYQDGPLLYFFLSGYHGNKSRTPSFLHLHLMMWILPPVLKAALRESTHFLLRGSCQLFTVNGGTMMTSLVSNQMPVEYGTLPGCFSCLSCDHVLVSCGQRELICTCWCISI